MPLRFLTAAAALLGGLLAGCAPAAAPASPTVTLEPSPSSLPTRTPVPLFLGNDPATWDGEAAGVVQGGALMQTFVSEAATVRLIEVGVLTVHSGGGDDELTLRVLDEFGVELARASLRVAEGFDDWLGFGMPGGVLGVSVGRRILITLEGGQLDMFGWKHSDDFYPNGQAILNGRITPDRDFLFRVYP